jgi:Tol biopolymer transport system component
MKSILIGTLAAILAAGAQSNEAERQLKAAMNAELVNGDLKAAIKQYGEIAAKHKNVRGIAAQALLRLAEAYQKLGDAEAKAVYERIVRDFSDQSETVEQARRRLAALADSAPTAAPTLSRRKLWSGSNTIFGAPASDGRVITYNSNGDLALRDLGNGTSRLITTHRQGDPARNPAYVASSRLSSDGKRIVFAWNTQTGGYQLRLINSDGSGERTIHDNPEVEWIAPIGWSPDGGRVLVKTRTRGQSGQIAWISTADGTARALKTLPWTSMGRVTLSPDARYVAYDALTAEGSRNRTLFVLASDGTREVPLSNGSAIEEVFGWMPDGRAVLFRTNRRGAQELWAIRVIDGKPTGPAGLIQPEMEGAWEPLGVTKSGSLFCVQVGVEGAAHVADIDWDTGTVSNVQTVSHGMIVDRGPDWSPDGRSLAFVAHRGTDLTKQFIAIRSVETGDTREVVAREDLLIENGGGYRWSPDGKAFLAAAVHPKYGQGAYTIDLSTGDVRLLANAPGSRIVSPDWMPDGRSIAYTLMPRMGRSRSTRLFIRDLETGTDREVPIGVPADAELLTISYALAPDGRTLAVMPFDPLGRTLSVVSVSGGAPRQLLEAGPGETMWIVGWTPDGRRITYRRTNTAQRTSEYWSIPIEGGEPHRFAFRSEGFRAHPNGRRIAYIDSRQHMELWAVENLVPSVEAALKAIR